MALSRVSFCLCRSSKNVLNFVALREQPLVNQVRGRKRWHRPLFRKLYWRRIEQGPEPERPRSAWLNWNYNAEIYALGKRLHEDFNDETLKRALTDNSYIEKEKMLRKNMEMEDSIDLQDNSELMKDGEAFATDYIKAYLRHSFPALPEEGICSVSDYLMSEEMLAKIGSNLGIKDLILCSEFPPSTQTISDAFKAMIGALIVDQGNQRAQYFVQDFILTMLVGKDVMELWPIVNPMGVLQGIIQKQQRGEVESRLLYQTGVNTVQAAYMVGVYSDKELLGKGFGETVSIAEEMAARDALRRFFRTTLNREPLPFSDDGRKLDIDIRKVNPSIKDYLSPSQLQ